MTGNPIETALTHKVRFYPKSKLDLINRSKLKKVRSFEESDLRLLAENSQRLIKEVERQDMEGPDRSESWRLEFELELRDDSIGHLFKSMAMAADLILALNKV